MPRISSETLDEVIRVLKQVKNSMFHSKNLLQSETVSPFVSIFTLLPITTT